MAFSIPTGSQDVISVLTPKSCLLRWEPELLSVYTHFQISLAPMGLSVPEAKADPESHPPHHLIMNKNKSGFKALPLVAIFAATVVSIKPSFGQAAAPLQTKKTSTPAICFLSLRGAARYNGPCGLSLKTDGTRTWYSVDMLNFGTTFVRQGEGLYANEINGGSFKATAVDRGGSLIVNWNFNNVVISRDCTGACKLPPQGVPGRPLSAIMDSFFGS
jgi:hypothetical protein